MIKVIVNGRDELLVEKGGRDGELLVNQKSYQPDLAVVDHNVYHLLLGSKGYRIQVMKQEDARHLTLEVNGNRYEIELQDRYDLLLKEMGMDRALQNQAEDVKAPMPGLVLDILVEEGEQVAKDTPLIILEAMKMENVLKAAADGVVAKILVKQKDAVEKGQVLIAFE
jgi:biotin carboxyl carrier protein